MQNFPDQTRDLSPEQDFLYMLGQQVGQDLVEDESAKKPTALRISRGIWQWLPIETLADLDLQNHIILICLALVYELDATPLTDC